MYQPRQLVEVSGEEDEGFPGSLVLAAVVSADATGANVQYMEVSMHQVHLPLSCTLHTAPVSSRGTEQFKVIASRFIAC